MVTLHLGDRHLIWSIAGGVLQTVYNGRAIFLGRTLDDGQMFGVKTKTILSGCNGKTDKFKKYSNTSAYIRGVE